jgi:hypothetical protein
MYETWVSRDLPVLAAIVEWRDADPMGIGPTLGQLSELTGFDGTDVLRAIRALDGTFISMQLMGGGGDLSPSFVTGIGAGARQTVGQWPSGESLVEQLVAGLRAAEMSESDPVQKGRLRAAVDALSGIARDVVVQVATSVVTRSIGQM